MRHRKILMATSLLLAASAFNANASLTGYTVNGVDLVYSSISNVTWTKDANLLSTLETQQGYNTLINAIIAASPTITDLSGVHQVTAADFSTYTTAYGAYGLANWFGANAFVGYLNSINYGGSKQWSLPSYLPMYDLWHNELGGQNLYPIPDTATFDNEPGYADSIWYNREWYYPQAGAYLAGYFVMGGSGLANKTSMKLLWAVTPGQVTAVPVPAAAWLFGSGLIALLGVKRRKTTA